MFALTPSTRTVVDCMVHSPLPVVTLAQPGHCHQADWLPMMFFFGKVSEKCKVKMSVALMNLDTCCC